MHSALLRVHKVVLFNLTFLIIVYGMRGHINWTPLTFRLDRAHNDHATWGLRSSEAEVVSWAREGVQFESLVAIS